MDLKLTFSYNAGNEFRKSFGLMLKEAARKIGIDIEVESMEWSVFLNKLRNGSIDMWYGAWIFDPRPSDPNQLWHSSASDGGSNYTGFGNAKTDALIERIPQTLDETKRNQLYKEWQEVIHEEVPYVFILSGNYRLLVSKRFDESSVYPTGLNPGYHIQTLRPAKDHSTEKE